jgi:hypothetical protein
MMKSEGMKKQPKIGQTAIISIDHHQGDQEISADDWLRLELDTSDTLHGVRRPVAASTDAVCRGVLSFISMTLQWLALLAQTDHFVRGLDLDLFGLVDGTRCVSPRAS